MKPMDKIIRQEKERKHRKTSKLYTDKTKKKEKEAYGLIKVTVLSFRLPLFAGQ